MLAFLAAPCPSREKPLGFGCRLVGVVRRECTGYLVRRHVAQRPPENGVSLVPVPPNPGGRNLSVFIPDARAIREVQVLVPREGVEPDQSCTPDRRDKSGKSGRDPTIRVLEVCISLACRVGRVLLLVGEITALNWIKSQLSDDGAPLLGCPRWLRVFSHAPIVTPPGL
jgi:hypothetical protein